MTQIGMSWRHAAACALLSSLLTGCSCYQSRWPSWRSQAIPDRYPLGSVTRAHFHAMQTNAEASDFVITRNDFAGDTSELSPDGKDHVLEIAARMRSAPFPVLIERSENNSNPELDAERRQFVANVLADLGNSDADQRTIVSTAYSRGLRSVEGEFDYARYVFSRSGGFMTNFGNTGFGNAGGFGATSGVGFGR